METKTYSNKNNTFFVASRRYRSKDDEVSQLFPIMLKELICAAQADKEIMKVVRCSALPVKVDSLLHHARFDDDFEALSHYRVFDRVVRNDSCSGANT